MDLQIFKNPEFGEIRTTIIDGVVYFVGKDIATALGYSNTRDALIKRVDNEDMRGSQIATPSGVQQMTVINESGLYSLILSSKLPNAKKFKRWVTSEVLPSIRKRGVFATDDFIQQAISNPKWAIDVLSAYQEEKDKNVVLLQENAVLNQQVAELTPKADYYDVVMNCPDLLTVSQICKDYGMSAKEFNRLLHKIGIQYKQNGTWLLYQEYAKKGWTQTATFPVTNTKDGIAFSVIQTRWTQKGRYGLYQLLKDYGILPTIELQNN